MVSEIIEILEDNGLTEIEALKVDKNYFILKFYYDFDNEELSAAKNYANEESDLEEESDEWYKDWYLAYLNDIAKDNVDEIMEEIYEDFEVEGICKSIEMDSNNFSYMKFIVAINNSIEDIDLEDILNDYL